MIDDFCVCNFGQVSLFVFFSCSDYFDRMSLNFMFCSLIAQFLKLKGSCLIFGRNKLLFQVELFNDIPK